MPFLHELRLEGGGLLGLSVLDVPPSPLTHGPLLGHTGLVLEPCRQEACLAETAPLGDC